MNQAANQPVGRTPGSLNVPLNGRRGSYRGPELLLALQPKLLLPNPMPQTRVANLDFAVRRLRAKDASVSESFDVAVVVPGLSPGAFFLRPTIYLTEPANVIERWLRQDPPRPG